MISAIAYPQFYNANGRAKVSMVSNEKLPDRYWHTTSAEHKSEYTARDQWNGLHKLAEEGEFIRNIKVEVTEVAWQEVDW
jgi:hypothetical protein